MSIEKVIEKKIEKLINLELTKGVKPSEVVDNIFFENYNQIILNKENNCTMMQIFYMEAHDEIVLSVELRYYYDDQENVVLIKERVDGIESTLWSREERNRDLINEICVLLSKHSLIQVNKFLETLPSHLRNLFEIEYKKLA